MDLYIDIRQSGFDVGDEQQRLSESSPDAGGQVLFVGLVRDYHHADAAGTGADILPHSVHALELSHYEGMTENTIANICHQAEQNWNLSAVRVIHRIGRLSAGEQIVLVAVASAHRAEAFNGAEFIMDELKTNATFWKKEIRADGDHWVDMKQTDITRSERWQSESGQRK